MITKPITINGLTINDYAAGQAVNYDGWIRVVRVRGLKQAEYENEKVNLAFQHGVLQSETWFRERLITVECEIIARSRVVRENLEDSLRAVLSPIYAVGQTGTFIYQKENENFNRIIYCKPTGNYVSDDELSEKGIRKVSFSLIAEKPFIYKNELKTKTIKLNKNLLLWTEDITKSVWAVVGTATKTDADSLTSISVGGGIKQSVNTGNHANKTYNFQVELKGIAGETITIAVRDGSSGSYGLQKQVILTNNFVQHDVTRVFGSGETATNTEVYIYRNTGDTATQVDIRKAQLTEGNEPDIYRKNEGTYAGTNGVTLPSYLPLFLATGIGDKYNIKNEGNFVSLPFMKIWGSGVKPGLVNETTGKYIQFNYSLDDGQYLLVDFANRTVKRENGSNVYGFITQESRFFDLAPGINVIGLIAETYDPDLKVDIEWRDTYI